MNFWEFLDKQFGRLLRAMPGWPDGRGLVGVAAVAMSVWLLHIYHLDRTLRDDDFFKTIATAVVITGFVNAIIGWAFGDTARGAASTVNSGKFADAISDMVRKQPDATGAAPGALHAGDTVTLDKTDEPPVKVE